MLSGKSAPARMLRRRLARHSLVIVSVARAVRLIVRVLLTATAVPEPDLDSRRHRDRQPGVRRPVTAALATPLAGRRGRAAAAAGRHGDPSGQPGLAGRPAGLGRRHRAAARRAAPAQRAYTVGSPRSHRGLAALLAAASESVVYLPDYRLARRARGGRRAASSPGGGGRAGRSSAPAARSARPRADRWVTASSARLCPFIRHRFTVPPLVTFIPGGTDMRDALVGVRPPWQPARWWPAPVTRRPYRSPSVSSPPTSDHDLRRGERTSTSCSTRCLPTPPSRRGHRRSPVTAARSAGRESGHAQRYLKVSHLSGTRCLRHLTRSYPAGRPS